MRSFVPALGAVLLVVAVAGCGRDNGPPRIVVSGIVTYRGEPVTEGLIRFVPTKGSTGPVSVAKIAAGNYRTDAKGGVPLGTHKVEILAYHPDPKSNTQQPQSHRTGPALQGPPKEQYLPAKYNTRSGLEIVVEAGHGEIHQDFDLAK